MPVSKDTVTVRATAMTTVTTPTTTIIMARMTCISVRERPGQKFRA